MTRYPQQASHFYSFIMPDYPSYQRFIVGTEDAIPEVRQPLGGLTMKRNTKIALVMMALSAMAMGSTSAFAHGGHGMWQQNAAPLTSEQQTAWQKIHNDFYAQSSALQQQLVTKRYEYNALLAANPPDSSKINAVAKEMENLRQSLDELRVKRDIAMAEAGIPRGTGMGYGGCGGGGHMGMGHW